MNNSDLIKILQNEIAILNSPQTGFVDEAIITARKELSLSYNRIITQLNQEAIHESTLRNIIQPLKEKFGNNEKNFIIGHVMRITRGRADPDKVRKILDEN